MLYSTYRGNVGRRFCLLPSCLSPWRRGSVCDRFRETCGARKEITSGSSRVKGCEGGIPSPSGVSCPHIWGPEDEQTRVRGRRLEPRFLWPQVTHLQRPPDDSWNRRTAAKPPPRTFLRALSSAPPVPAASPWRRAEQCGCARVTERGRRGGGVLVLAACRPFPIRSSGSFSFLLSLPFPFSLSQPQSSLPPSLLPFFLFSTAAPGPGHFPGRAH